MFYFVWASRLFSFALQNYEFDHVTITDDSHLESEGETLFVKVLVQKIKLNQRRNVTTFICLPVLRDPQKGIGFKE